MRRGIGSPVPKPAPVAGESSETAHRSRNSFSRVAGIPRETFNGEGRLNRLACLVSVSPSALDDITAVPG